MSEVAKYRVKWTTRFKKDYKLAVKRGYNFFRFSEDSALLLLRTPDFCGRLHLHCASPADCLHPDPVI